MSLLAWGDQYLVSVSLIDEQHRRLFSLINDFYVGLRGDQTKQSLSELLVGMTEYTLYHFGTEHDLMKRHGYPVAPEHLAQHATFVAKAEEYAMRLAQGKMLLPLEVTSYLRDWIVDHILVTDRLLGAFLREKGIG